MKKILLDDSKNYYKANLHCHCTKSDGKLTAEETKELYRKNGYSVVALTDHDFLHDNTYLNDEDFLFINSVEINIREFANMSPSDSKMKLCHLNMYAKDPKNLVTPCYDSRHAYYSYDEFKKRTPIICDEYEIEYSGEGISEIIRIANEKGFLVCYNHPRWSLENATDYLGYKNLWAVEIYNTACEMEGIYEYNINAYDDLLRDGQRIACVATDDTHFVTDACGGFVMINADKLDYQTIIEALENHNFYASTGPVIKSLYIEDDKAYITFENAEYVTLSTKGRRADRQTAPNPNGLNTLEFKIQPDDVYVRFDVVDKYGKRANTNAYFI